MTKCDRFNQLLLKIKTELDKRNITFWLHAGILLGAVKFGDFIRNDQDIDLGFYEKDLPKVMDMVKNKSIWNSTDYTLINGVFRLAKFVSYWSCDLAIMPKRNNHYYLIGQKANENEVEVKIILEKMLDNLRNITLRGVVYKVPDYTEDYLSILFPNWRTQMYGKTDFNEKIPNNFFKKCQ